MKNILVFGAGELGKKVINQYIDYNGKNKIVAILDNNPMVEEYRGIPVVHTSKIGRFLYDEIWVCTIFYSQIKKQLLEEYGIEENKILYMEPTMVVLEERIRQKYEKELQEGCMGEIGKVLEYIKNNPVRMYCYPFYDEYMHKEISVQYDESKKLYFVMHHDKKMYFSGKMNTEQKARSYYNSVIMEQDQRSPHCYWNNTGIVNSVNGIVVDVGAAEGIFALDIIDKAKHIYLIEVEEEWIEALQYTFEPYKDKVTIIRKFVSNYDDEKYCKLDTLFENIQVDCIKMDIEGEEYHALQGAEELLKNQDVHLAVCVYHHQKDNQTISTYLNELGYETENSKGYIVCQGDWELDKDEIDFRRGLIFARKRG